jgi:hypothetical protein
MAEPEASLAAAGATRRTVLKGGVALGAAAVLPGLAACQAQSEELWSDALPWSDGRGWVDSASSVLAL